VSIFLRRRISEVTERRVHHFMLSEKGVPSAVVWTVCRWCLDCAAGPELSFYKRGPAMDVAIVMAVLESK